MPTEVASEAQALSRAASRRAQTLAALNRVFARELGRVLRDLERTLIARLPEVRAGQATALIRTTRGLALRRELRQALSEAGYDRLIMTGAERAFDRLERLVAATTVGRRVARWLTTDPALDRLRALRVLAVTGLEYQGEEIAISLWRSVVQHVYSERPVAAIVDDLAIAIDRSEREARTLYDTATATYTRMLEVLATPTGPREAFLYTGPDDAKTRPFCDAHVGRVYTRRTIQRLDNETPALADVMLHGGGYNCRHVWMHVPSGWALADLADTGQLVADALEATA